MDKGKVEVKSNSLVLKILSEGKKIVAVVTKQGTFHAKSFILLAVAEGTYLAGSSVRASPGSTMSSELAIFGFFFVQI